MRPSLRTIFARTGISALLLCAALLLVACGQKGDLYLPDDAPQQEDRD
jgi:predicted small lipoprotein YifL